MESTNRMFQEVRMDLQALAELKDPYKQEVVYLKKVVADRVLTHVAKISSKGSIEFFVGVAAEAHDEKKEISITNFLTRGFITCTKEEYDQAVKKTVETINALV